MLYPLIQMNYWAPFLHLYQPPIQDAHVLKDINDSCYEPLFSMLLDNPRFKITLNVNSVLLDLLHDHGLDDTVELLKELIGREQVDLVGTAKYHPILPLIPRREAIRQIKLQEQDCQRIFPNWEKRGFFAPEMAISPGVVSMIHKQGYRWLLGSGISCSGDWLFDKIYQSPEGMLLFFRDDIISNEISFKRISVDAFIKKLNNIHETTHYIITAQDGETFGHHVPEYENTFLKRAMQAAIESDTLELCWISDLENTFKIDGRIRVINSSWSTMQSDLDYNTPYPLWNHPDNPVHRIQFKFFKAVLELVYLAERVVPNKKNQELITTRYFLDSGLHSCQLWWASARPMWSPNLIMKGAELLLRSAFNARLAILDECDDKQLLSKSESLFDQITQYHSLLLMEIMEMERDINGKRNIPSYYFESLFLDDSPEKKPGEMVSKAAQAEEERK
ncbi:hypothetical protein GF325_17065 [Candidatus Bathyarchaeota archaeon]|nr:hypothetical protein [Candidatus Bathyarchaeota archaeon]